MYWNTETRKFPCFIHRDFFLKGQLLSEIATDEENISGCESGDWALPIYEKNRVRKSHATVPIMKEVDFGLKSELGYTYYPTTANSWG